jgi:hypothetical protein
MNPQEICLTGLAKSHMFCFCSLMTSSNDNKPPPEAVRVLPILGKVDPRGDVVFHLRIDGRGPVGAASIGPSFPNDPREA